ncbi:hypothetical protein Agub_g15926, partial [Astrephomene gubernaculifera]
HFLSSLLNLCQFCHRDLPSSRSRSGWSAQEVNNITCSKHLTTFNLAPAIVMPPKAGVLGSSHAEDDSSAQPYIPENCNKFQSKREGHRPLLTAAQAVYLAREVFGIGWSGDDATHEDSTGPSSGSGSNSTICNISPDVCVELPSYDDRSFRIRTSTSSTRSESYVVLKVHNSRDGARTSALQAMDAAMLRVQQAGVLTNTPLPPLPPLGRSAGGGGGDGSCGGVCQAAGAAVPY